MPAPSDEPLEGEESNLIPFPVDIAASPFMHDVVTALPWPVVCLVFRDLVCLPCLSMLPPPMRRECGRANWSQIVTPMGVNRLWFSIMRGLLMAAPMDRVLDNCPERWALKSLEINLAHLRQCNHPATMYTNGLSDIKTLSFDHPAVRSMVMGLLPLAVARNFRQATKMLLDAGAEHTARDRYGYSCLYIAAEQGFTLLLIMLVASYRHRHSGSLDVGIDVDIDNPSAAAMAAINGRSGCLAVLLDAGASMHRPFRHSGDGNLYTLPTYLAAYPSMDLLTTLIDCGLKNDLPDSHPNNLMMLLIHGGKKVMLRMLLTAGWTVEHVADELRRRRWACSDDIRRELVEFRMWPDFQPDSQSDYQTEEADTTSDSSENH